MTGEASRPANLQDAFLNYLRKERIPVTVHVMNGYQLNHLTVISYDSYAVLARSGEKQMLLYKHAISTITPEKSTDFEIGGKQKESREQKIK